MASVGDKWLTLHQSDTSSVTESALVRSRPIDRNVILLVQQFLPAIRQISSEFFIFQQDSALARAQVT